MVLRLVCLALVSGLSAGGGASLRGAPGDEQVQLTFSEDYVIFQWLSESRASAWHAELRSDKPRHLISWEKSEQSAILETERAPSPLLRLPACPTLPPLTTTTTATLYSRDWEWPRGSDHSDHGVPGVGAAVGDLIHHHSALLWGSRLPP